MSYTGTHRRASSSSFVSVSGKDPASGRTKTEQVVVECLFKIVEVVTQARVNFQPDIESRQRRARFNLDIDEIDYIRRKMSRWKSDVHTPLCLDVFWDPSSAKNYNGSHGSKKDTRRPILLERWVVQFRNQREPSNSDKVIAQLRQVCKRIGVMLRVAFTFARTLPAYRLFRSSQGTPSAGCMGYALYAAGDNGPPTAGTAAAGRIQNVSQLSFSSDVAVSSYGFPIIEAPYGNLVFVCQYRRDCSFEVQPQYPLISTNVIIQDYVPSRVSPSSHEDDGEGRSHTSVSNKAEDSALPGRYDEGQGLGYREHPRLGTSPSLETYSNRSSPMEIPKSAPSGVHNELPIPTLGRQPSTSADDATRVQFRLSAGNLAPRHSDSRIHAKSLDVKSHDPLSRSPGLWNNTPLANPFGYTNHAAHPGGGESYPKFEAGSLGSERSLMRSPPLHPRGSSLPKRTSAPLPRSFPESPEPLYLEDGASTSDDAQNRATGKVTDVLNGAQLDESQRTNSPSTHPRAIPIGSSPPVVQQTPPFSCSPSIAQTHPSPLSLNGPTLLGSSPPFTSQSSNLIYSPSPRPSLETSPGQGPVPNPASFQSVFGIGSTRSDRSTSLSSSSYRATLSHREDLPKPFWMSPSQSEPASWRNENHAQLDLEEEALPFAVESTSSIGLPDRGDLTGLGDFLALVNSMGPLKDLRKAEEQTVPADSEKGRIQLQQWKDVLVGLKQFNETIRKEIEG